MASLLARPLRALTRRHEPPHLAEVADVLAESPLFARFTRSSLLTVAETVHLRQYARGETLYYEGDPAVGLYVVQDGLVRLSAEDEDGAVEELNRHARGSVIGETALLGDFRRAETAHAVRDATVLGLFRPDLRMLLKRAPKVGLMVTVAVAQRLAAREEALLQVLREGHLPAHKLLHRLQLTEATDPGALVG